MLPDTYVTSPSHHPVVINCVDVGALSAPHFIAGGCFVQSVWELGIMMAVNCSQVGPGERHTFFCSNEWSQKFLCHNLPI